MCEMSHVSSSAKRQERLRRVSALKSRYHTKTLMDSLPATFFCRREKIYLDELVPTIHEFRGCGLDDTCCIDLDSGFDSDDDEYQHSPACSLIGSCGDLASPVFVHVNDSNSPEDDIFGDVCNKHHDKTDNDIDKHTNDGDADFDCDDDEHQHLPAFSCFGSCGDLASPVVEYFDNEAFDKHTKDNDSKPHDDDRELEIPQDDCCDDADDSNTTDNDNEEPAVHDQRDTNNNPSESDIDKNDDIDAENDDQDMGTMALETQSCDFDDELEVHGGAMAHKHDHDSDGNDDSDDSFPHEEGDSHDNDEEGAFEVTVLEDVCEVGGTAALEIITPGGGPAVDDDRDDSDPQDEDDSHGRFKVVGIGSTVILEDLCEVGGTAALEIISSGVGSAVVDHFCDDSPANVFVEASLVAACDCSVCTVLTVWGFPSFRNMFDGGDPFPVCGCGICCCVRKFSGRIFKTIDSMSDYDTRGCGDLFRGEFISVVCLAIGEGVALCANKHLWDLLSQDCIVEGFAGTFASNMARLSEILRVAPHAQRPGLFTNSVKHLADSSTGLLQKVWDLGLLAESLGSGSVGKKL